MENERLPEDLFDCYLKVEKEIRETEAEEIAEGLKEFAKWAKEYGYGISVESLSNLVTYEKLFDIESEKEEEE